MKTIDLNTYTI